MSKILAPRSVVSIVVVLAAAIGCWFVFGGEAPPTIAADRSAVDEAVVDSRASTVVDLAAAPSAPSAPNSAASSAIDPLATDEVRAAVGSALVGATWGELLVAVDRGTRQPIEGATIALVDAEGERREVTASDAVLATDLADGVLVALAAPMHLTRVFFAHHVRDHTGPPRVVSLHPTGGVRVRLVDELDVLAAPLSLQVFTTERRESKVVWGDEVDAEPNEATRLGPRDANMQRNLRFIASADSDARERKRQMRWLSRSEDVHPLLTPDGPPAPTAWSNTEFDADDPWPRSVTELPIGFDVVVKVAVEERESPENQFSDNRPGFEFRIAGSDGWSGFENSTFITSIDASVVTEIEVRGSPPASVRGLLPLGARSGRVQVVAGSGGTIVSAEAVEVDVDGAFHISDLKPGAAVVMANWKTSEADVAVLELPVLLEAGRELDLGRLATRADGRTLTLATRILVDGEPASAEVVALLEGAELALEWMSESIPESSESLLFHYDGISVPIGARATLTGLAPQQGRVFMRAVGVEERTAGRFHMQTNSATEDVDLEFGDETREFVVSLEATASCAATFTIPAGSGLGHVSLEVYAYALEGYTRLDLAVDESERLSTAQQHTLTSALSLPRGDWLVVGVARPADPKSSSSSDASTNADSFIGTARVTVGEAPPAALVIELTPAACLRVAVPAGGGASAPSILTLNPVGLPRSLANIAMLRTPAAGSSAILYGLLPDTEYTDRTGSLVVRTGAPGSVTELELR
jgi:hypothetical protein